MSTLEATKKELSDLQDEGNALFDSLVTKNLDGSMHYEYQSWYTRALPIVRLLAPERYDEFKSYYEVNPRRKDLVYSTYAIQDYLRNIRPSGRDYENFDSDLEAGRCFLNQLAILDSLNSRVESALGNLEASLYLELQEAELSVARRLNKISPRAAGALAGVVLEAYLQRVVQVRGIKLQKRNPTLADLNDPLKQAGVYDVAAWRKISYLTDLRNLCTHKKASDPSRQQVQELVDGVDWVIRNVA